ncbi:hypothetical protein ABBQ38_002022 [Trebouxia sp. C0009 RCD-2024]
MGTERGSGLDQQGTVTKSKTDIFSPRSPVYRTPLTSRRNNGNLPAGQQKVPGLILPQAPYLGSLQQQHLQRNGVSLYSPRSKQSAQAALQGPAAVSTLSPRQTRRTASKDHSKGPALNIFTNPEGHAAPAAGRPVMAPLRHQTSQQQSQLYSPRRYVVPAPLEALSPRAALHCHHTGQAGSHAQPAGGSSTWRGPLTSHGVQHAATHTQQLSKHQSLQSASSIVPAPRDSPRQSTAAASAGVNDSAGVQAMTPPQALQAHSHALTGFEQSEILNQQQIYFLGLGAKKIEGQPHSADLNHGYDDEWGDLRMVVGDHIGYRFEILSRLGKGSFGQVLKCRDHKTGEVCALKVIQNQKRFHKQALIEIRILDHLRNQDRQANCCVVHMHESLSFRSHLCISFELLSINLYDYIKANNFRGSSLRLIRKFAYQVLVCLRFLRAQKVLHCDLKPENILLKENGRSGIKVIDFGSSCFEGEQVYSYIQSRFYRSPEVMLGLGYGTAIDMWSLACILAELYTGFPLFPGENEAEQMQCVMEVLGPPPAALMDRATRKQQFFEADGSVRITPNKACLHRFPASKDLGQALRCKDGPFIAFLQACLKWNPDERMTPEEALQHPWIQTQDPPAEPSQPLPAPLATWSPRSAVPPANWLSRLRTDAAKQVGMDAKTGSHTSRPAAKDANQGLDTSTASTKGGFLKGGPLTSRRK